MDSEKILLQQILEEMHELKADVKEVRQNDLPKLREEFATVKERSNQSARLHSTIVSVIVSAIVTFVTGHAPHN